MIRRNGHLSLDDRILWGREARTVTPRKGMEMPSEEELAPEIKPDTKPAQGIATPYTPESPASPSLPRHAEIDRPSLNKLAKGRIPVEGRIDLHGLTQGEAHGLLLGFLHRAHAQGMRHVLVITGKGSSYGSDGALKRIVPLWLQTPAFRGVVSAYDTAARNHGGGGALYVRIRRT